MTEGPMFGPDLTLEEAVRQAVGAASLCWTTPEGAGTFDEAQANRIADDLIDGINTGRWSSPPPVDVAHHLTEAARLIGIVDRLAKQGRRRTVERRERLTARAEVHARIAHAAAAAGLLRPAPGDPTDGAGLDALVRLATAMEAIARSGVETRSGGRGE